MALASLYRPDGIVISFELFPPKSETGHQYLMRHVEQLMRFSPDFITCTYGAGGSTRDKTLEIVDQIKRDFCVPVASHLTVVGSSVDQLRLYLDRARKLNVDYIVALRGDPPNGQASFEPTPGGFSYANELVSLIRKEFSHFGIAVAGYPETHREAPNAEVDLDNLKRKVDAGAHVVVTQLFYDNRDFFSFRDRCDKRGIKVPIVPGIMPVVNLSQIQRITSMCGARLPAEFVEKLAESNQPDWHFQVGVEHAIRQTVDLLEAHVPGLHFYVLNRSDATNAVLEAADIATRRSIE
jgi:methylenetetrahydrofolate reductase (NADPH)